VRISDYCFQCGVQDTPKKARLADVICTLVGFNVMASNLESLDPPKSDDYVGKYLLYYI
jgi:hypothetical protein